VKNRSCDLTLLKRRRRKEGKAIRKEKKMDRAQKAVLKETRRKCLFFAELNNGQ
jgi:hypothetical protein